MTQNYSISRKVKTISNYIIEKGIKLGGAKVTNGVDDVSEYTTVKDITSDVEIGYVSDYGDSSKLLDILRKCNLLENDHGDGGVLYKNGWYGTLTYWLSFSDMSTLCRFLVAFNKYADTFTYDKIHDGKWHMCFDIHDDPLTGVDSKTTTFLLQYFSKTTKLDEINKAINDLCEEIKSDWENR